MSITVRDFLGIRLTWTEHRVITYNVASCESIQHGLSVGYRSDFLGSLAKGLVLLLGAAGLLSLTLVPQFSRKPVPVSTEISIPLDPGPTDANVKLHPPFETTEMAGTSDMVAPQAMPDSHQGLTAEPESLGGFAGPVARTAAPASVNSAVRRMPSRGGSAESITGTAARKSFDDSVRQVSARLPSPSIAVGYTGGAAAPLSFNAAMSKALETQEVVSWQANGATGYVAAGPPQVHDGMRCHTVTSWESGGAQGEAQSSMKCLKIGVRQSRKARTLKHRMSGASEPREPSPVNS